MEVLFLAFILVVLEISIIFFCAKDGLFPVEILLGSNGYHRPKSLLFKINRFLVLQPKINKPTHSHKTKKNEPMHKNINYFGL